MDEVLEAARERAYEIDKALLGDADAGYVDDDGPASIAIHTGVPAQDIREWAGHRADQIHAVLLEQLAAAAASGEDVFDVGPLFAGMVTQAFLMGWLVRDEQEKRG
jgi:hypothetical protein